MTTRESSTSYNTKDNIIIITKNGKVHTRLTLRHLMSTNNQQPTCGNQTLNNKTLPTRLLSLERKHTLLGKDCEVEKVMRFLREIRMLEEI